MSIKINKSINYLNKDNLFKTNNSLSYIKDCNNIICQHNIIKIDCTKCHRIIIFR
jgi:hypothetical protein